ncbi:aldehyde dehydrogenase family protein [Mycobacterium paraintracellulare]|uniref:aldehyde dehydrogenase family protein n=2 Tax=Mycobacterium paraintracellulare TaxID=1138383 RepID=UPI0002529FA2|nr:aldehyde dehydrogenase family protein [Mycobacterium paraintracellulare]AFC53174.1 coniferyl-aldehyde dehydrogenase [Mycobacterium paraintracellulare]OSC23295.1 aldehyde dehydrogenase family protein [Mycobacterium paraintracellulare]
MTSTRVNDVTVTASDVLADMRRAFESGRTRPLEWRRLQLEGIERMCMEREADIAAALAKDLGRSAVEAWLGDVASTKAEAAFARKNLRKWMRRQRISVPMAQLPARAWVQYDPLGTVLVIGPWNYPFYLSMAPVVAAVAAGNCVVVKPSELAPATSSLIADLVPRYLDADAVRVVEGDAATTQTLLSAGFDHAFFTGGTEVGRKIMAAAAPTLTPVTLELGGKSPAIVTADADVAVTARRLAYTKFINSGQTCIAPDYVLVEPTVADELVDEICLWVERFRSASDLPIVNERQFDRLIGLIADTTGDVVFGGNSDRATMRIEPTLIVDPAPDEPVMTEEIFGPILPIITVDSVDAACQYVNQKPKPLALYIFSKKAEQARQIIDRTPSGGVVVNHAMMHCLVPQLPFGGVGASGMGDYHGRWGFETMSHRRAVLAKTSRPDPSIVYPPYSRTALRLMRRMF